MRIPEHKYNEIRKSFGKDKKWLQCFLTLYFLSIDAGQEMMMICYAPEESQNHTIKNYLIAYLIRFATTTS